MERLTGVPGFLVWFISRWFTDSVERQAAPQKQGRPVTRPQSPATAPLPCCTSFILDDGSATQACDAAYYRSHWCGKPPPENLQFLDDRDCAKRFPANCSREWRCPVASAHAPAAAGWAPAAPLASVRVDRGVLAAVPQLQRVHFAAVLVRRTASGGVLYRYFGGPNHTQPFETWSSSKIFAVANAAVTAERACPAVGGLTAETHGRLGATPLGDLATIICSYDRTMNYSSNSLARYFHDIGGRRQANWLVQDWLGAGVGESFGGNYVK